MQESLKAAVKKAAEFLNRAGKVIMVIGSQIKKARAIQQTLDLANACDYPVAVMPRSKGLFPETHAKCDILLSQHTRFNASNQRPCAGCHACLAGPNQPAALVLFCLQSPRNAT